MSRALRLYKPQQNGKGAAVQFHVGRVKKGKDARVPVLFAEATRQDGPKPAPGSNVSPFKWADKATVMLNVDELGEIIAYIRGLRAKAISQIHTSERGDKKSTSRFELKRPETDEEKKYGNWLIKVGRDTNNVLARLSPGEVIQLLIMAEEVVRTFIDIEEESF